MSTTIQEQSDALKAASAQRLPAAVLETFTRDQAAWRAKGRPTDAVAVGDVLNDFTLPDATGRDVSLSELVTGGPAVLVFYRGGADAFKRRGGTKLLSSELRLQREFRKQGFTSPAQYVRNVMVRGGYRLTPVNWHLNAARLTTEHLIHRLSEATGESREQILQELSISIDATIAEGEAAAGEAST